MVTALYGYDASEENEVSFAEGDRLELLVRLEDDWWLMRKDGLVYGMAPSNYFESSDLPHTQSQTNIFADQHYGGEPVRWIDMVDVKYAWSAKLTLRKNDKRKGELVVGDDRVIGFVTGPNKVQLIMQISSTDSVLCRTNCSSTS